MPRGPRGLVPKLQHVNSITNFPKALGHASARGLEYFERPVNADERAARYRSKLRRTWATAPDGAQALAFSAWGSSLRAGPVSWPPCARAGWPPPSRGSCARTAFHTPCGASSRENALALHLLFEDPERLIDIVVAKDDLQNVSNLLLAPDAPSSC